MMTFWTKRFGGFTMSKLLIDRHDAIAVCVDFQTSLVDAVYNAKEMKDKTVRMCKCLKEMGVTFLVSQQYTKGLGDTDKDIKEAIGDFEHVEKMTFSCVKDAEFMKRLEASGKKTVILCGIESHICVMQTALELKELGYNVWLIADCCSSRTAIDKENAIRRMICSGVNVTTYETAIYEMLGSALEPEFKAISRIVK